MTVKETLQAWRRGELEVLSYGFACGDEQMPRFTTNKNHPSSGAWVKFERLTQQGDKD